MKSQNPQLIKRLSAALTLLLDISENSQSLCVVKL